MGIKAHRSLQKASLAPGSAPAPFFSQYHRASRSAYYGVVCAIPLLLLYEGLLAASASRWRNSSDVWLRFMMESLDISPQYAGGVAIFALLLALPWTYRHRLRLRPSILSLMLLEALLLSLLLGPLVHLLLHPWQGSLAGINLPHGANTALLIGGTTTERLALSIGAGLFEEMLFRVVIFSGLWALLRQGMSNWLAMGLATLVAASLFSLAHHVGAYGDLFSWPIFGFRFIAGILLSSLYAWRGFAITTYTHVFYDILVIVVL